MAQPWHRWREPLAVTLLVLLSLPLILWVVVVIQQVASGRSRGLAAGMASGDNNLLLVVAAGAVLWCATPLIPNEPAGPDSRPALSPHAWPIAIGGVVVVGLTVLGSLVLTALSVLFVLGSPPPETGLALAIARAVLPFVVPLTCLVAVIIALRRVAAARAASARGDQPALPADAAAAPVEEDVPAVEAAPERLPAAWQADEATGAVWLTADDAAQGRPGLSWSDPAAPPAAAPPAAAPPAASEDDDLR